MEDGKHSPPTRGLSGTYSRHAGRDQVAFDYRDTPRPDCPCGGDVAVEPNLLDMVRLHVAQIHSCQVGIEQHSRDLRKHGEKEDRIASLQDWSSSLLYNRKERYALALAESITFNPKGSVTRILLDDAHHYFSREQMVHLLLTIQAVNDWNT